MNRQTEQAVSEKRFRPRPARRLVEQRGQEVSQCLPQRQPPRQPQRQHRLSFCPQLDRRCAKARTGSGWRPARGQRWRTHRWTRGCLPSALLIS
jgi:hypothetical protein